MLQDYVTEASWLDAILFVATALILFISHWIGHRGGRAH